MIPEPTKAQNPVRFGEDFELDVVTRRLRRGSHGLKVERIPLEILALLVERPGEIVTRDEIVTKVWGKSAFLDTDNSIRGAIRKIRQALKDDPEQPRFIQTVTGRGYRFIAPVVTPELEVISPEVEEGRSPQTHTDAEADRGPRTPRAPLWLALGGLTVLALLAFAYVVTGSRAGDATEPKIKSLAVLPLNNLSGDPQQEYFADGMTEALITELGKISAPRVISRQSIMQYKGSKKGLREIAAELKVDAILEGTVERAGDRIHVVVRLVQVSPEGQLWSSQYNRDIHDLLWLHDQIAREVTDEIHVKLTPEERTRLTIAHAVDPEAHDDYLRGRYLLGLAPAHSSKFAEKRQFTEPDINEAIGHFKRAIEKDPAYASAYAGLADAYITLGNPVWGGHSPRETLSDAKAAATKALELDSSLAEAHFSLAQTFQYDWNWSEAEKEYRLALKLNPNYADAHLQYGRFVQALGRNDEAMTQMNYAIELDPFSVKTKVVVAYVTWASRQYDLSVKQFESLGDDFGLMWAYREKDMYPEAIAAWQRWKLSHPSQRRHPHPLAVVAGIYGLQGRKHEAQALIDELRETARHRYVSGFFFAEAYVGLGEKDQAITSLERAYEDHDQWMVLVNTYPGFDRLRSEPRFQALLRRMNFPP